MIRVNGKLAITPGEYRFDESEIRSAHRVYFGLLCYGWSTPVNIDQKHPAAEAYGELIAESLTVTNECGKTPRELLDLCRELHTSLAFFSKLVEGSMGLCGWHMHGGSVAWGDWQKELDAAKSALDKSEGV